MGNKLRSFCDWLQVWCYVHDLMSLGRFFGRYGHRAKFKAMLAEEHKPDAEVPTLRNPSVPPRSGPGWSLDEIVSDGPLKVVEFDPTFNKNASIDVANDVALPTTKHDIN